jgi:hypothetical protein
MTASILAGMEIYATWEGIRLLVFLSAWMCRSRCPVVSPDRIDVDNAKTQLKMKTNHLTLIQ